ncbi:hypothetical protein ABFS82_09G124500 [Erythranthe guttata]
MDQNNWPAIRSGTMEYIFESLIAHEELEKLEALQLQLKVKEKSKACLLQEEEHIRAEIQRSTHLNLKHEKEEESRSRKIVQLKAEIRVLENEIRRIEEAIDRQKSASEPLETSAEALKAELERKIECFSTPRWKRITHTEDLHAIHKIKNKFPNKTIRFCLGSKARSLESIQRMAELVGIGAMAPDVLYEVADRKFRVLSEAECQALYFT